MKDNEPEEEEYSASVDMERVLRNTAYMRFPTHRDGFNELTDRIVITTKAISEISYGEVVEAATANGTNPHMIVEKVGELAEGCSMIKTEPVAFGER